MNSHITLNISSIEIKNIECLINKRSELAQHTSPIGLADTLAYTYTKDSSFFGKKQERIIFMFFQGLNTNPQNLSIFLRDQVSRANKQSKQKLTKGQFIIYDIFSKNDCVIQISIPGNFQIYKILKNKKELISNMEIDMMYVSSVLRSMVETNLVWGRSYNLFGTKNMLDQFKSFLHVFFKIVQKNDIFISQDFQNKCNMKGSHSCSILFNFIQQKVIVNQAIDIIEKQIKDRGGYKNTYPKMLILLAELYHSQCKYAKSLSIIGVLLNKYSNDPFLLYYQAKYMFKLMTVHQALIICNSIVQYNQLQIWSLLAEIHLELKNYSQTLVCLNHACKVVAKNAKSSLKNIQVIYAEFEILGKKNLQTNEDDIIMRPRLMYASENSYSIIGFVEEKFKKLIDSQYFRFGWGQKKVYNILKSLKYRLENKKFQQLVENTFQESKKQYFSVNFNKGLSDSMFVQQIPLNFKNNQIQHEEALPNFLQDQSFEGESQEVTKGNRNLSIIPELESIIENSQFQQRQKQSHKLRPMRHKKQINESFYKLIGVLLDEHELEKAQFEENWAKVTPIYNKFRTSSKLNTFYSKKMMDIMMKVQNYKSILVIIANCLDTFEQAGLKKIQIIPYWMQRYIFQIIEQKGLKYLNNLLQKMEFLDEAVIDTIELAKNWKIKGCTF